ncbi:MAG: ABC transporter permease [Acidobacteriia bacterium]|nr:ABC transporter permease [Terriglobia bacterium]
MGFAARTASLFRNLFRRSRVERELDDELSAYVDLLEKEKLAAGLPPAEALRAARMEAGAEQVKERVRDVRTGALVEQFAADVRYGTRVLRRNPVFAAVAVLTLALGIGATTAIFSVVYGVLLRPLPFHEPDRIVELREVSAEGNRMNFADPNFEDLRTQVRSLKGVAEYASGLVSIPGRAEPTRTVAAYVSQDFSLIMRVQPVLGRGFVEGDQRYGAPPVVLVSYGYWKQYLDGANNLSAVKLTIENQAASVIGVLPPGFHFPADTGIWIPRELLPRLPSRTAHNWHALGRLGDGVPLAQARAELSAIAARLNRQYGKETMMADVAAVPLQENLTSRARPALLILLGSVGFLLLIACANVMNLLLAQAAARTRELAIRTALGAGRRRLLRQFLTEALLLAFGGGVLGVVAAMLGVRALIAIAPHDLPRLEEVSVNLPVLLFALGVSILVAGGLGVFTALRVTSGDLHHPLAEGSRGEAVAAGAHRAGRAIIAAQLAVTLVLLVGAGLLGRSLLRVLSVDPGFRTGHVLTIDLALPPAEEPADAVRRVQFLNELSVRLRLLPGVREVGGTNALPLADGGMDDGTYILMNPQDAVPRDFQEFERLAREPGRTGDADYCAADEGYFRALGIPLLRGRLFDDRDTMDASHAALISESLARQKFPSRDPLGRLIEFGNMDGDLRLLTIVGVVGDVRGSRLEAAPRPIIYVNYRQRPRAATRFTVVIQADAAPAAVLPAAREIVRTLDPKVPPGFSTFSQIFSASLDARRFNLTLIAIFAGTALLLSLAGIYGVTAYTVARRTREIGVRMALGARPGDVLRLVLGQGMLAAAVGVAIGVAGSLALTRTLQSLLFGVSATDPVTFAAVALLLVLVAFLTSCIPARRATRVDPMVALRYE